MGRVTATASPAALSEPASVEIAAQVSDGVARVQLYWGERLVEERAASDPVFQVPIAFTRVGEERFELRGLDAAGATVASATTSVDVNIPNRILYVSGGGDDANDGLASDRAKRTLRAAAALTQPGDIVLVGDGTYREANPRADVLTVSRSGAPSAWITYAAYPGETPRIEAENWNAVAVRANYITIKGFTMVGNRERLTLEYALSEADTLGNPITSGNGVQVRALGDGPRPHHVRIEDNLIQDFPGGGVAVSQADYITIEGNRVFRCGWYAPYGNSGISIYQAWNSDGSTATKMFIRNNVSAFNQNLVPFYYSGDTPAERRITDGNGIIIEDSRNTQRGSPIGPYPGGFLIENNIVYANGGRGVNIYLSDNVTLANNTAWSNARHPDISSEFNIRESGNVRVLNSIFETGPDKPVLTMRLNGAVSFSSNLFFGGAPLETPLPAGSLMAAPRFVNPEAADFRLAADSPAIDAGQADGAPARDILGTPRPQGAGVDLGALERAP